MYIWLMLKIKGVMHTNVAPMLHTISVQPFLVMLLQPFTPRPFPGTPGGFNMFFCGPAANHLLVYHDPQAS
jgi:hypothetical protein